MSRLCLFAACFTVLVCRCFAQGGLCNHQCISSGACNWKHFEDTCYYLFKNTSRTWSESKHLCQHENLDVGQIQKGFQTNDLFHGLYPRVAAWQGGEIRNLDKLEYVNGERFTQAIAQRSERKCGIVKTNRRHQIVFEAENCDNYHYSICRSGQDNITVSWTWETWFNARSACVDEGGDLFYLHNSEDVYQILRKVLEKTFHTFYIGVKNFKWQWPDGTDIRRYNWASREPGNPNDDCIALYGYDNSWHDWSCQDKNYAVCQKVCRVELKESWGQFSSPNYRDEYPPNTTCEWLITVAEERKIHLLFLDFHATSDATDTCHFGSVEVYDGLTKNTLLAEYCGATLPAPLNSTGNSMKIIFKSGSNVTHPRFLANYYLTGTECSPVSHPQHGFVTYPDGWHVNAQLKYQCEAGYELQGTGTRQCQADGRWTATAEPMCILIQCPDIQYSAKPTNGFMTNPTGRKVNGTLVYGCNTGYVLVGSTTRWCQSDGKWTPLATEPTCTLIKCPVVEPPTNGQVTYHPQPGRNVESTLTYKCKSGYIMHGTQTRTCQADGKWTSILYYPTCQPTCPSRPNPQNGTVFPTGSDMNKGTTVFFACNEGFTLKGHWNSTCLESGNWSHSDPVCSEIACNNLDPPTNGNVSNEEGHPLGETLYGHKVFFSCNKGFILNGCTTLTCIGGGPEGRFDGQPPTCESFEAIAARISTGTNTFPFTSIPIMPIMLGASAFINFVLVVTVMCLCRQYKCLLLKPNNKVKDEEDEHAYADISFRPEECTPLEDRPTHDGAGSRPEVNIPMAEHNTQGPARIDIPNPDQENTDDYLAPCDPVWHNRQKQQHETEETQQASNPANLKLTPRNDKSKLQVAKHTVNNGACGATAKASQDDEPKYLEVIASPEDIGQSDAGNETNMKQPQLRDAAIAASRLSTDESYDYAGMPRFILPPQMKGKDDKSKKNESYVDMESLGAMSSGHKEENTSRNGMNENAEFCSDDDHDEYDDVVGTSTENQFMALGSEEEIAAESSCTENMYMPLDKKTMSKK